MVQVQEFFDEETFTLSYVIFDDSSRDAVILDAVLDFEPAAGLVWTQSVQDLMKFIKQKNLQVHMILESHAHADHLSGSQELKRLLPDAKLAIGQGITEVQAIFKKIFNLTQDFAIDGRQFDRLLRHGEIVRAGSLSFEVVNTPGHTPACVSFRFEDKLFTGDALFMPDYGTGRCDFPGGSAEDLYHSITQHIYKLPGETKIYTGHDYQPNGRPLRFMATVEESRRDNIQLKGDSSLDEFVKFRNKRDASLSAPRLLFPSVQVNIDAGHLPAPENNGVSYLKMPLAYK